MHNTPMQQGVFGIITTLVVIARAWSLAEVPGVGELFGSRQTYVRNAEFACCADQRRCTRTSALQIASE